MTRRQSRFRNVRGIAYNIKNHYHDINPAEEPAVSGNTLWIALAWKSNMNSRSIAILKNKCFPTCKEIEPSMLLGHMAPITDIKWNPFHDWVLASSDSEGQVKIWRLDQELNYTQIPLPINASSRINNLEWNPIADNVLACAGNDGILNVLDIETHGGVQTSLQDKIFSISWNYDASKISVMTNGLHILDPRCQSSVLKSDGHNGYNKKQLVKWLGDTSYLITSGFNRNLTRELNFWDIRSLNRSVCTEVFDFNSNPLMPFFDSDTNLLFLTSKGDTTIKVFDITYEDPSFFHELTPYIDTFSHIDAFLLPKRACNVMNSEVDCIHRVLSEKIVPIGFQIPRKNYLDFCEELFPDTPGDQPALTSGQWFAGKNEKPILVSLHPSITQISVSPVDDPLPLSPSSSLTKLSHSFNALEIDKSQNQQIKKLNIVRPSHYLNIFCKCDIKSNHYTNLKVYSNPQKNKILAINTKWFSVSWEGICGRVGVFNFNNKSIPKDNVSLVETGSEVLDMAWNPFHLNQLCTAHENSLIKLWDIPEEGISHLASNIFTSTATLSKHKNRILSVDYHPHANNLLISSSMDLTFKIWDLEKQIDTLTLSGFNAPPLSHTWNDNTSILATSSKDKLIKLWDPRQSSIISEIDHGNNTNGCLITWKGHEESLILSGQSKNGDRTIQILDLKMPNHPIATHSLGDSCNNLIPIFDPDTNILLVWGKGESSIKILELKNTEPFIHQLPDYSTTTPQLSIAFLPKQLVDVREVELFKGFKLTSNTLIPISFYVPRVKKEYFQDDIYVPTANLLTPTLTGEEWLNGNFQMPQMVSLKPQDMKNYSEIPKTPVFKKVVEEKFLSSKDLETKLTERLDQILVCDNDYIPGKDLEGVDESEWD